MSVILIVKPNKYNLALKHHQTYYHAVAIMSHIQEFESLVDERISVLLGDRVQLGQQHGVSQLGQQHGGSQSGQQHGGSQVEQQHGCWGGLQLEEQ